MAVFRQIENLPVCEPSELCREFVAFSQRRRDAHRKAVFEGSRNFTLEPAQMVDVSDDAFARLTRDRRIERHASRRHVDHLTRIFPAIRQHVAAEKVNLHALMPPAFLSQRQDHWFGLWQCHRYRGRKVFSAVIEPRSLSLTLR